MSDDLCLRLQNLEEAGVYQLNCPLTMLEANVALSGLILLDANIPAGHGKGGFLATLAQALRAPNWFGHNWDALADVLMDLSWQPATGYVLLLKGDDAHFGLNDADFDTAMSILNETVTYWQGQQKPFWVFLAHDL